MDPRFLLIQQIKVDAEQIEQYMQCVYSEEYTSEQRRVVLNYLYTQTRHLSEFTDRLFQQYHSIKRTL